MSKEKFETALPRDKFSPDMRKKVEQAAEELKDIDAVEVTQTNDEVRIKRSDGTIEHLTKVGDQMPVHDKWYHYDDVVRALIFFPREPKEQEMYLELMEQLRSEKKNLEAIFHTTNNAKAKKEIEEELEEIRKKEGFFLRFGRQKKENA